MKALQRLASPPWVNPLLGTFPIRQIMWNLQWGIHVWPITLSCSLSGFCFELNAKISMLMRLHAKKNWYAKAYMFSMSCMFCLACEHAYSQFACCISIMLKCFMCWESGNVDWLAANQVQNSLSDSWGEQLSIHLAVRAYYIFIHELHVLYSPKNIHVFWEIFPLLIAT